MNLSVSAKTRESGRVFDAARGDEASGLEEKRKILTHRAPSIVRSIADAAVIKDYDLFLLTEKDGSVPMSKDHGFGLYFHDCRYLDGYEARLSGKTMNSLDVTTLEGFQSVVQLANPGLSGKGASIIDEETFAIRWTHALFGEDRALQDVFEIQNFGMVKGELSLSLAFRCRFQDIFNVRGLEKKQLGRLRKPEWRKDGLEFGYSGADGIFRGLFIRFSPAPTRKRASSADFSFSVDPNGFQRIILDFHLMESKSSPKPGAITFKAMRPESLLRRRKDSRSGRIQEVTDIRSDSLLLNRIIEQSMRDLKTLSGRMQGKEFHSAGLPWFGTLFGRDSLVTCLQSLVYRPETARDTLELLARYQGTKEQEWNEEQPGRILHEHRRGELAKAGIIPYRPFYGTIDATPLFLILLARHSNWTGSLELFRKLRRKVSMALRWMDGFGDRNQDGYLDYHNPVKGAQINQGWKDAGDAIVNTDGSLARTPISLVEVQGYAYAAKKGIADLLMRNGEAGEADRLLAEAADLRGRFNRDFWMEDRQFFALGLQGEGEPISVISSNPGHALWSGIVETERAGAVRDGLMAADMFSGWGVRTLSNREIRFNPIGYHLGTVWPHDNALIAAGLRRYGFDDAAKRIFHGIFDAASHFTEQRLPELFCGFPRSGLGGPVNYPIACHPQAWAAGSIPLLIETLTGMESDGFAGTLHFVRPMLPDFVDWMEFRRLKVGKAEADVRIERSGKDGKEIVVRNLKAYGSLKVTSDPAGLPSPFP